MNGPLCELELRRILLREDLCVATRYGGKIPYSDVTVERIEKEIEEVEEKIKAANTQAA